VAGLRNQSNVGEQRASISMHVSLAQAPNNIAYTQCRRHQSICRVARKQENAKWSEYTTPNIVQKGIDIAE
jgi:hypothetical protein